MNKSKKNKKKKHPWGKKETSWIFQIPNPMNHPIMVYSEGHSIFDYVYIIYKCDRSRENRTAQPF